MTDLTAADLARIDSWASGESPPPWETESSDYIAIPRAEVGLLVAIVRDLARAIVGAEAYGAGFFVGVESCPFCDSGLDNGTIIHMDHCIMRRAKALTGGEGDGGKYAYIARPGAS